MKCAATSLMGQQATFVSWHCDRQRKATLLPVPVGRVGRWRRLFLPALPCGSLKAFVGCVLASCATDDLSAAFSIK